MLILECGQKTQCTITLHVDDLMITSKNEKLIDELTAILKKKYEREDRGKGFC